MHIVAPARYKPKPRRASLRPLVVIPLVIILVAAAVNYLRPLPVPVATLTLAAPPAATTPYIAWLSGTQAAIAADGYGLLGTTGSATPLATASIAKVITALCVLQKQPLAVGQDGATYTVGASDVDIYQKYANENGSLIPVTLGEKLTEYQALQALMIPSANNIADSLVRWVFGSQAAYTTYATYATSFLQQHGLNNTHIGNDASGFDPGTTSTASDLTNLGLLALKQPALMTIAGQRTVTLPVVGTVNNYDTILGVDGITGLKTGNNDADPGAFLFTATAQIGDKNIPLTGAVMGAADLGTALHNSTELAKALQQGFEQVVIAKPSQTVGKVRAAWGQSANITAPQGLQIIRWKATPLTETHSLDASVRSGTIGSLKISAGQVNASANLQLQQPLADPSFWWRLTRH